MEDKSEPTKKPAEKRASRGVSFWIVIATFLMLFGLLLTGAVIAIVRLLAIIAG
ncbi:MAG TPA: hypothetical protein VK463_04200 [Desulfomonilaceae bacterium]|nr:hypothetical protein [Desulfomonilaceae bacterium]